MKILRQKNLFLKKKMEFFPEGLSVERLKRARALSADLRDLGFSVSWHGAMMRFFARKN
jgi:hypothetical protein